MQVFLARGERGHKQTHSLQSIKVLPSNRHEYAAAAADHTRPSFERRLPLGLILALAVSHLTHDGGGGGGPAIAAAVLLRSYVTNDGLSQRALVAIVFVCTVDTFADATSSRVWAPTYPAFLQPNIEGAS